MTKNLKSPAGLRNISFLLLSLLSQGCSTRTPNQDPAPSPPPIIVQDASKPDAQLNTRSNELAEIRLQLTNFRTEFQDMQNAIASMHTKMEALNKAGAFLELEQKESNERLASLRLELDRLKTASTQTDDDDLRANQRDHSEFFRQLGELRRDLKALAEKSSEKKAPFKASEFSCTISKVSQKAGLITLNKGSDDGILKNEVFEIYDGANRVGRVKITMLYEQLCLGEIIEGQGKIKAQQKVYRIKKQ